MNWCVAVLPTPPSPVPPSLLVAHTLTHSCVRTQSVSSSLLPVQEFVCDLLSRRHCRLESLTEPVVIYTVLTAVGMGPVLSEPDQVTFRWSVDTPEDIPFPYIHLRMLAIDG